MTAATVHGSMYLWRFTDQPQPRASPSEYKSADFAISVFARLGLSETFPRTTLVNRDADNSGDHAMSNELPIPQP